MDTAAESPDNVILGCKNPFHSRAKLPKIGKYLPQCQVMNSKKDKINPSHEEEGSYSSIFGRKTSSVINPQNFHVIFPETILLPKKTPGTSSKLRLILNQVVVLMV